MKNLLIPDSLKSLEKQIDYFDGYIVGLDAMAINTNVFLKPVDISNLIKKYPTFPTAMQAIGYKEIVEYLENKITKEESSEEKELWFKNSEKPIAKDLIFFINSL